MFQSWKRLTSVNCFIKFNSIWKQRSIKCAEKTTHAFILMFYGVKNMRVLKFIQLPLTWHCDLDFCEYFKQFECWCRLICRKSSGSKSLRRYDFVKWWKVNVKTLKATVIVRKHLLVIFCLIRCDEAGIPVRAKSPQNFCQPPKPDCQLWKIGISIHK